MAAIVVAKPKKKPKLGKCEDEKRESFDEGRAEAAKMFPLIHDEGFAEGWAACLNMIFRMLRERAREDPNARALLIELLNG